MTTQNVYSLDIMTATWGPKDITSIARCLYANDPSTSDPSNNSWTFTPSVSYFGVDPLVGYTKVFVCV
jgi:hypothetical protein